MDEKLLSTREAAELLGVGTTSIKRWADEGLLACVKTAGGHRRYERHAVLALLGRPSAPAVDEASALAARAGTRPMTTAGWIERLVHVQGSQDIVAALELERERSTRGSWLQVAEEMGRVIIEIGRRWESGEISVLQEHLASARLMRAIVMCCESIPLPPDAPRALLMTAANDDHTVGLQLVELVLREVGWAGRWVGRRAPIAQVVRFVEEGNVEMVAISASSYSTDAISLAAQAERLGEPCRRRGIPLYLGGSGAWPDVPPYGQRVRGFGELRAAVGAR
jgi:excisionase family DNA binding protein